MSGFDSRCYQIFWEEVGLERGPLSLVSTIEELLGRKSSSSSLDSREYGRRNPSSWPRGTLYPQTLALTSLIRGGRSFCIVRSRTQATEFSFFFLVSHFYWNIHCVQNSSGMAPKLHFDAKIFGGPKSQSSHTEEEKHLRAQCRILLSHSAVAVHFLTNRPPNRQCTFAKFVTLRRLIPKKPLLYGESVADIK
jgi:hypothetical protein